jgi:hypothetical protein
MPSENDIHKELQAFGPYIVGLLDAADFFDLPEGPYDPLEWDTKIKQQPEYKRYVAESKKKNSRVWDLVKSLFIPAAIGVGIATIRRDYKPQLARQIAKEEIKYTGVIPPRPTAQDYQNQYIRERGGEFITKMSRADQQQLTRFLWKNSGEHERPLAKRILKQEPTLAYLVDNKEYRLRAIKRTETHRATMYGSWKYSADWGAETKTRGEAGDGRTRPSHRAQIGITVLINEPYPDGEQYPGEMSINCRGHNIFNFDKSKLTKDPQKVYEENLASAEEDARIARKAEREAAKAKPVEIQKAKPIGGEVIPRKVAPFEQPKLISLDEHKAMAKQSLKNYNAMPDELKRNVKEILISPNAWREDAALSEKYGHKVITEAAYDAKNQRILGFPDMNGAVRPISKKFMAHELAHGIDDGISGKAAWLSNVKKDGNFASKYAEEYFNKAGKNYSEDFAESMRRYVTEKDKFVKECPNRADYLERVVLSGKYRKAVEARKK